MKELIKRIISIGHAQVLETWEPAVLEMKREGYNIKCNGQRGVVTKEKFQQATAVWFSKIIVLEFSLFFFSHLSTQSQKNDVSAVVFLKYH